MVVKKEAAHPTDQVERPARKPGRALLKRLVNAGALVTFLLVSNIWAVGIWLATEGAGGGDCWAPSRLAQFFRSPLAWVS
jgi:hypothetical protein